MGVVQNRTSKSKPPDGVAAIRGFAPILRRQPRRLGLWIFPRGAPPRESYLLYTKEENAGASGHFFMWLNTPRFGHLLIWLDKAASASTPPQRPEGC